MKKKITIHQPDFMPWLGFFNKINKADTFVVLDHTHNNPRDSSFWCRRVKILINSKEFWLSVPLNKPPKGIMTQAINEMTINEKQPKEFTKKLQQIRQSYTKHPYFEEVFPIIEDYMINDNASLFDRNMGFIKRIMNLLEINTEIVYSSSLNCTNYSTELLIEIIKKLKGDIYLCGGGSSGYQKDVMYEQNNIALEYNNFCHPEYSQKKMNTFVAGLSIIDPLMNLGFEEVKKIL